MTVSGRSMDDQPLAAYSRRGKVEPKDDEPVEQLHASMPWHAADEASGAAPAALAIGTLDQPMVPSEAAAGGDAVIRLPKPALGPARDFVRANPRLVAGAGFVAVILFGLVLLSSGSGLPGAAGIAATPSAPAAAPVVVEPGSATLVLTGSVKATYTLTGNAGQPVAGNAVTGTWTDPLQNLLKLAGPVDRGTRTTDADLVLTWSLTVGGKLVTFTSSAGECTIGMAVNPTSVSGSFSCRKLKSADGKLTVEASGTYRT
jgi:hypothetical protein